MASTTATVKVTKNNFPAVMSACESGKDDLAKGVAQTAEDAAKAIVPVLHGFLLASIKTSGGGGSYSVTAESMAGGAPRQYAFYVEYGTRKMNAEPFMTPAAATAASVGVAEKGAEFGAKIEAAAG